MTPDTVAQIIKHFLNRKAPKDQILKNIKNMNKIILFFLKKFFNDCLSIR